MLSPEFYAEFFERCPRILKEGKAADIAQLVSEDVVMQSLVTGLTYQGRDQVAKLLETVMSKYTSWQNKLHLLENGAVVSQWRLPDGEQSIVGTSLYHFNSEGFVCRVDVLSSSLASDAMLCADVEELMTAIGVESARLRVLQDASPAPQAA